MNPDAYEQIRARALADIEKLGIDPDVDHGSLRALLQDAVEDYQRRAELGEGRSLASPEQTVERLFDSVVGLGPIGTLLRRPDVEEIFIEGGRVAYLESQGMLRGLESPATESENRAVVERLVASTDRRLDASNPVVQARILEGGARLTAVIPPVSDRLSATIRRYALRSESLAALVELGSLSAPAAEFLAAAMRASASVIVSGPPGAGKTSFLSALIAAIPSDHCVRSCEEVRELHVPLIHGSYYEARPPFIGGGGAVTLRDLVKVTLAMRPDVIAIGEVRGAEAFELTRAVNAGCGLVCTIHSNSASDALDALANAALMAGENIPERVVRKVFSASIDLVVHLDRFVDPSKEGLLRRTTEIRALGPATADGFNTELLFWRERPDSPLKWTGAVPPESLVGRLERAAPDDTEIASLLHGGG